MLHVQDSLALVFMKCKNKFVANDFAFLLGVS